MTRKSERRRVHNRDQVRLAAATVFSSVALLFSAPLWAADPSAPLPAPTASPSEPAPVTPTPTAAPAAPAPAPAPAPAAPAAPAPAPPPPPAAPPPVAPPRVVLSPGEAVVHVAVTHRDAWLEMRDTIDGGDFVRTCEAPCDLKLQVEGREARVVAPGMTTSNVFRFDAGAGTAGVRVDGGSASLRRAGIITLAAGIPVALAGMALFAQGRVKDDKGLQIAGIAGLAVGGVTVSISLPLLMMGTTHVKNAKGSLIALSAAPAPAL